MLYLTRVNKFGMVTIMGTLLGLLMTLTGHPWIILPFATGLALLANLALKTGKYRSWKSIRLGHVVFSEWLMRLIFPIFFMRGSFFATLRDGYGDPYADTLMRITPPWQAGGLYASFIRIREKSIGWKLGGRTA